MDAKCNADGLTSGATNANAGDTTVVNVMAGTSQTTTWENGVQYVNGQTMNPSFNVPDTSTVSALTFGGRPSIRVTSRDPLLGALGGVSLGGRTTTFGYDYRQNARTLTTYLPPTVTADGSARADSYAPLTGRPTETAFSVPRVDSVLHRAYGYDSVGRLASEQVAINSYTDGDGARERQRQFSYDSLGRLKSVVVRRGTCMPWPSNNVAPDSLSESFGWRYTCGAVQPDSGATFSYDAVGNRTDHGAVIAAGNRLVKFNGDTISYDDDGNMTRRYNTVTGADHRYVWNALGQLDSAIVTSGSPSTTVAEHYSYDASGRLVHIDRGDPSQNWMVYQGDQISELIQSPTYYTDVAYDDGTDRPALEYTHGLPSDVWHAQIIDVMGNVAGAVVTDTVGMPYTWDVWGRNTSTASDGTEVLGWKGLPAATGSGLVYMRARWYDPAVGRFLSEDPIGLGGGLNQYAFAGDDPINASDPSGAVVTDAQGAPCSFYAASCGDPLEMPGRGSTAATQFWGGSGSSVSYAGGFAGSIGGGPGIPPRIRKVLTAACLLTLNALPFCKSGDGPNGGQSSSTQESGQADPLSWFQTHTSLPPEQPQPIDTTVNRVPSIRPTCFSIIQCARNFNWPNLPMVSPLSLTRGYTDPFFISPAWVVP